MENYESYFMDYLEGKLDPSLSGELAGFMAANPDLKEQLEGLEKVLLIKDDSVHLDDKKALKKAVTPVGKVNESNAEEFIIAYLEQDLNSKDQKNIEQFLALNPAFNYDRDAYAKTIQTPDLSITFPGKDKLKKHFILGIPRRFYYVAASAAAILLIFFGLRFLMVDNSTPRIADISISSISNEIKATVPQPSSPEIKAVQKIKPSLASNINMAESSRPVREPSVTMKPLLSEPQIATTFSKSEYIFFERYEYLAINDFLDAEARRESGEPAIPGSHRNVLGKVFAGLLNNAKDALRVKSPGTHESSSKINFWMIAGIGIEQYNALTDKNVQLIVRQNEEGKVTSYALVDDQGVILARQKNNP